MRKKRARASAIPPPPAIGAPIRRRSIRLTAGLLVAILLLGWGGGMYVYWVVRVSKERDLGKRLTAVGQFAADELMNARLGLPMVALAGLVLDTWPPEDYGPYFVEQRDRFEEDYGAELADFLRRLATDADLRRAMIVDIHQRAIADSDGEAPAFEVFDYLSIDAYEMEHAAEEKRTYTTLYYAVGGSDYMRSYTPLTDDQGTVFAFVRLEASRDYFAEMRQIRSELIALAVIVTILLGLVAFVFQRLLQYLLHVEQAVAQSDRFQSIATLAAGFAHEVRNPLGIIRSCAEGLADEFGEQNPEAVGLARDMVEEVVRLDSLITQFLQMARPAGSGTWRPIRINDAIQAVVSLARKDLEAKQLTAQLNLDPSSPAAPIDEKALKQVIFNILLNAKEATDAGGSISVATRSRRGRVEVVISDTGRGISESDLKRVFDPFFTTKKGGTGLGLSLSRRLVEQFGGSMAIYSQEGRGTTVEISFSV